MSEALRRIDNSVKNTQQNLSTLQAALKLDPKSTTLISDAYKIAATNTKAWGREIATLQARNEKWSGTANRVRSRLAELERQGKQNTLEYQFLSGELENFNSKLGLSSVALDIAKTRLIDAENVQRAWSSQLAASQSNVYKWATGLSEAGRVLSDVGDSLFAVGKKMTVFSTIVATTIGRAAISNAEEFGNQISRLGGYLDISGDKLQKMSDLALYWGKETIFSAVEAAEAMNELAKGGLTEAEIKAGALEAALSAAAAGGITMSQAADVVVQTMRTFNMDAADSATIADALAGAANASTAEINDLSQGFVNVGGMARLAGWDVHDVSGALALMADNGFTGAVAGTALKVMLQRLAAPSEKAAGVMEELGINVRDAEGHMKPATEIVKLFSDATAELSDEERDAALQTIFGTRAINAILALMNSGSGTLQRYINSTQQQGYAAEMAKRRLGDLGWALELLRGEAETAAVNLGRGLTPMLVSLANAAEDALEWFNGLTDAERENIAQMGLMVVAAGPVAMAFGAVLKVIGGASTAIGDGVRFLKLWNAAGAEGLSGAARLGTAMANLAGDADNATKYIAAASSAIGGAQVALISLAAAGALFAGYMIWDHFRRMEEKAKLAAENTHNLEDAINGFNVEKAIASADDYVEGLDEVAGSYEEVMAAHKKLADSINERNREASNDIAVWERTREVLQKYSDATHELTYEELGELQLALDDVNEQLGTNWTWNDKLKRIVDDQGNSVENLTEKIDALIAARIREIEAAAYEDTLKDLYKQRADEVQTLTAKQEELRSAEERYAQFLKDGTIHTAYGDIALSGQERMNQERLLAEQIEILKGEEKDLAATLESTDRAISRTADNYGNATKAANEASDAVADLTQTLAEAASEAGLRDFFDTDDAFDEFIRHLENAGFKTSDFVNLTGEQQSQLVAAWQDTDRRVVKEFAFMTGKLEMLGDDWAAEMQGIAAETGYSSDDIAAALARGIEQGEIAYNSDMPTILGWLRKYAETNPKEKNLTADESDVKAETAEGVKDLDAYDKNNPKEKKLKADAGGVKTGTESGAKLLRDYLAIKTPTKDLKARFSESGYQGTTGKIGAFAKQKNRTWLGKAAFSESGYGGTEGKMRYFWSYGTKRQFSGNAWFGVSGDYWGTIGKMNEFNKYSSRTIVMEAIARHRDNAAGGIRKHAEGAIVNVPKTGYPLDLVGEDGAEAIVPLTNRRYSQPFVDMIAKGVAGQFPVSGGVTVVMNGLVVREDADIDRIATALNTKIIRARGGSL